MAWTVEGQAMFYIFLTKTFFCCSGSCNKVKIKNIFTSILAIATALEKSKNKQILY